MKIFLATIVSALVVLPASVEAAPFLNSIVPEACQACPCGFGGVLQIIQNLMNFGIGIAIIFATIIIAWGGFLYIMSSANPESRSKANKMLINAAIGLLVVLSAWLIVDFVMKSLYDGETSKFGPWNTIIGTSGDICIKKNDNVRGLFDRGVSVAPGGGRPTTTQTSTSTPSQPERPTRDELTQGPFSSESQAARAALQHANPRSIRDNLEYGGLIYRDTNGQYWSGPVIGTDAGVSPSRAGSPSGAQVVGDYHTHADYSLTDPVTGNAIRTSDPRRDDYNSDSFSEIDRQGTIKDAMGKESYRGYLGTPSGRFLYYDGKTRAEGSL